MAKEVTNVTTENLPNTFSSIYSDLLSKRKMQKEAKEEEKLRKKEEKEAKEKDNETEAKEKKTKKEKREAELEAWKSVISGLTGDDLDYSSDKKKKKKYTQWIDDDTSSDNTVLVKKSKKQKKENYNKKFEPDLNMLKRLVADQNRFTADLQKRFNQMAGPSTKDAMPLNKTQVELASVLINSRSNSLGILREIGNIKKTVADLQMKQRKLESDLGGNNYSNTSDLGLLGSSIASQFFGDNEVSTSTGSTPSNYSYTDQTTQNSVVQGTAVLTNGHTSVIGESFDPSTWDGGPTLSSDSYALYENIPHSTVVEWKKDEDIARFKAVRDDTGEELVGCPVPTSNPSKLKFNEKDMIVKGEFDETYKLEII